MDNATLQFLTRLASARSTDTRNTIEQLIAEAMTLPQYQQYVIDTIPTDSAPTIDVDGGTAPAPAGRSSRTESAKARWVFCEGTRPTAISIDGTVTPIKTWREAYAKVAEIAAKANVLPPTWIKSMSSRLTVTLADGQLLYANLNREDFLDRVVAMAKAVKATWETTTIVITYGDGKTFDV